MGKHREPRPAPRRSLLPALQNAALPAAILIVVGVIALASPALRGAADEALDGTVTSAEPTAPASTGEQAQGRARTKAERKDLAFRAEIVPATTFVKRPEPQIPESFVRVPRSAVLPTAFTVSSYNVLGFGHTVPGGNRPGWADGRTRVRWVADLLRGRGVDVVGFQEFQMEQFATFNAVAGGEYAIYPGAAGGHSGVRNSIAWRRSDWTLVEANSTPIPYFGGSPLPMPYLLLEHVETGRRVWFANFHNPADAQGPAQRHRDRAMSLEIALVNRLVAETGYPVVVTGDMNEREVFLCRVATGAGMHSADGGYADASGCHVPRPLQVDWIVATQEVGFSNYAANRSGLAARTSDHPMVSADAVIEPAYNPGKCLQRSKASPFIFCPPA
jgi:endonuclease/exonuclease/phosphatase family metal-dependent hydrolase